VPGVRPAPRQTNLHHEEDHRRATRHRTGQDHGLPRGPTKRTYQEDHYICPGCDSNIVARHPVCPDCPPTGRFGKNVYLQTTLLKFEERLPLDKIGAVLSKQGLDITDATVLELLHRTTRWLRPEYEKILAQIRSSPVVYTDQTGIKVDGQQHRIWTLATETETLHAIRPSKGRKGRRVLEELLGKDWPGILVCDGLRSHHTITASQLHPQHQSASGRPKQ